MAVVVIVVVIVGCDLELNATNASPSSMKPIEAGSVQLKCFA